MNIIYLQVIGRFSCGQEIIAMAADEFNWCKQGICDVVECGQLQQQRILHDHWWCLNNVL